MKKFLIWMLFALIFAVALGIELVDDLGRLVTIEDAPDRVVVASPAITNYLELLGVTSAIVGVTDWDAFAMTNSVEKIGNLVPLNLEMILSLRPDLVLISAGFQEAEVAKLETVGLKVFVVNPNTFEDIHRNLSVLGTVFNVPEKERIVRDFRNEVLEVAKRSYNMPQDQRPTVMFVMTAGSLSDIWTCGTGSFVNQAIAYAGGANVGAPYSGNNGWFPVSPEFVLKSQPEVILVPYYYEGGQGEAINNITSYKPFGDVPAVKNGRVYAISDALTSYANPRFLELVETLRELFY